MEPASRGKPVSAPTATALTRSLEVEGRTGGSSNAGNCPPPQPVPHAKAAPRANTIHRTFVPQTPSPSLPCPHSPLGLVWEFLKFSIHILVIGGGVRKKAGLGESPRSSLLALPSGRAVMPTTAGGRAQCPGSTVLPLLHGRENGFTGVSGSYTVYLKPSCTSDQRPLKREKDLFWHFEGATDRHGGEGVVTGVYERLAMLLPLSGSRAEVARRLAQAKSSKSSPPMALVL